MSSAVTNGILVTVVSEYIPERSSLSSRQFAFAYTVRIQNQGDVPAQLRSRHWIISDANGAVQEVRGDGVVGAAFPAARTALRVYELVRDRHGDGHDARHLPDGAARR
jgi:uncharacterized protein affecting Mg2+/Co2+ transport